MFLRYYSVPSIFLSLVRYFLFGNNIILIIDRETETDKESRYCRAKMLPVTNKIAGIDSHPFFSQSEEQPGARSAGASVKSRKKYIRHLSRYTRGEEDGRREGSKMKFNTS